MYFSKLSYHSSDTLNYNCNHNYIDNTIGIMLNLLLNIEYIVVEY